MKHQWLSLNLSFEKRTNSDASLVRDKSEENWRDWRSSHLVWICISLKPEVITEWKLFALKPKKNSKKFGNMILTLSYRSCSQREILWKLSKLIEYLHWEDSLRRRSTVPGVSNILVLFLILSESKPKQVGLNRQVGSNLWILLSFMNARWSRILSLFCLESTRPISKLNPLWQKLSLYFAKPNARNLECWRSLTSCLKE